MTQETLYKALEINDSGEGFMLTVRGYDDEDAFAGAWADFRLYDGIQTACVSWSSYSPESKARALLEMHSLIDHLVKAAAAFEEVPYYRPELTRRGAYEDLWDDAEQSLEDALDELDEELKSATGEK